MRVEVERDALHMALHRAWLVSGKGEFSRVRLITVSDREVAIASAGPNVQLVECIDCTVIEPGAIAVHAHHASSCVHRMARGARVTIQTIVTSGHVAIADETARFTMCYHAPDAPCTQDAELNIEHHFTMPADTLAMLVHATWATTWSTNAVDAPSKELRGLHLSVVERDDGHCVLRAMTSTRDLSTICEAPLPRGAERLPAMVVPFDALLGLRALASDGSGDVGVDASSSVIVLRRDKARMTIQLLDPQWLPAYEPAPVSGSGRVTRVSRSALSYAMECVSVFWGGIRLTFSADRLLIVSFDANNETASASVPCHWPYDDMVVYASCGMLYHSLQRIKDDELLIEVLDDGYTMLLSGANDRSVVVRQATMPPAAMLSMDRRAAEWMYRYV